MGEGRRGRGGGGGGRERGWHGRRIHNPWTIASVETEIGVPHVTESLCFLLQCISYPYSTTLEELRIHTSTTEIPKIPL